MWLRHLNAIAIVTHDAMGAWKKKYPQIHKISMCTVIKY